MNLLRIVIQYSKSSKSVQNAVIHYTLYSESLRVVNSLQIVNSLHILFLVCRVLGQAFCSQKSLRELTLDYARLHQGQRLFKRKQKGSFVKGRFWRMCPRSGFWYRRSGFCTLVLVFGVHHSVFVPSFRCWGQFKALAQLGEPFLEFCIVCSLFSLVFIRSNPALKSPKPALNTQSRHIRTQTSNFKRK